MLLNPYPWDSDGNLIIPRYGIRVAMAVALVSAGAFQLFTFLGDRQWHEHHPEALATGPEPLWVWLQWSAFLLTPFILSALLLSRRSGEAKAAGAGLAAALFGCGLIFAIAVFLAELVRFPAPDAYFLQNLFLVLLFLASSVWIIVSAFRIAARANWGVFLFSAAATLAWMAVANHLLALVFRE